MYQVDDVELGFKFPDPHQVPKKAFELHLRKNFPTFIKKTKVYVVKWSDRMMMECLYSLREQARGQIEKLD